MKPGTALGMGRGCDDLGPIPIGGPKSLFVVLGCI